MNLNGISIGHGIMFGQVGYLLGGLFLILIGLAVLYTLLYWRVRALHLEGEIIGVRQAGPYFHSVFRFVMPDGSTTEATSGQGSSSLRARTAGRRVAISVMPNQPHEVREAMSPTIWAGHWLTGRWPLVNFVRTHFLDTLLLDVGSPGGRRNLSRIARVAPARIAQSGEDSNADAA